MKEIKGRVESAQDQIRKSAQKAFKDLNVYFKEKTDTLRAGRLELARQSKELQFM